MKTTTYTYQASLNARAVLHAQYMCNVLTYAEYRAALLLLVV